MSLRADFFENGRLYGAVCWPQRLETVLSLVWVSGKYFLETATGIGADDGRVGKWRGYAVRTRTSVDDATEAATFQTIAAVDCDTGLRVLRWLDFRD